MCFKENEPVLKQHLYSVRQKLQSTLTISSSTHTCGHSRGGGTSLTCGGALVCLELGLMRAVKWGQQLKRSVNTLFESCPPPPSEFTSPSSNNGLPFSPHPPPRLRSTPLIVTNFHLQNAFLFGLSLGMSSPSLPKWTRIYIKHEWTQERRDGESF